jgi:hypothetical protein
MGKNSTLSEFSENAKRSEMLFAALFLYTEHCTD